MSDVQDNSTNPPVPTPAPTPEAVAETTASASAPAVAPAAASASQSQLNSLETLVREVSGELLRERRSDRRWRLALRLGWFGLVLALVWSGFTQRGNHPNAPSGPHTALVEVRGEIAADSEASAENLVASPA
jgi:protease-4